MDTALNYVGLAATTGVSAYVLAQLVADKMDTALDYVGLAVTTGISAYVLTQLVAGGSANRQLYHGMTTATAVGIATGVGSMVAKAGNDYVLPHIPQANKWKTIESASLNARMAGAGAWGYVALIS